MCLTFLIVDALSKLNMFDDTPSFFTSSSFQQVPLIKNKLDVEMRQSHLPDLVNGENRQIIESWTEISYFYFVLFLIDIDGIQKASNTNGNLYNIMWLYKLFEPILF